MVEWVSGESISSTKRCIPSRTSYESSPIKALVSRSTSTTQMTEARKAQKKISIKFMAYFVPRISKLLWGVR